MSRQKIIRKEKKKPKKATPLKRKLHIKGEEWSYKVGSDTTVVSPEGKKYLISFNEMYEFCNGKEAPSCYYEESVRYQIKPQLIKDYIYSSIINTKHKKKILLTEIYHAKNKI